MSSGKQEEREGRPVKIFEKSSLMFIIIVINKRATGDEIRHDP